MVHIIFYGLLVTALIASNLFHIRYERKQRNIIKWWCNKCVQYEQELRELKEKQNKRKKSTSKYTIV